jgi:hypothetical protein
MAAITCVKYRVVYYNGQDTLSDVLVKRPLQKLGNLLKDSVPGIDEFLQETIFYIQNVNHSKNMKI